MKNNPSSLPDASQGVGPRRREVYTAAMPFSSLAMPAFALVVTTALYFARDIFIPLALAILLSFALQPLVMLLRRGHFGRVPAVIAAVFLAFLVIFGVGSVIGGQLAHLAANLPQYKSNITDKIHSLRGSATETGILGRASGMLRELSNEITTAAPSAGNKAPSALAVAPRSAQPQPPIPVEIRQPEPTALQIIQTIIGPLLQPLAMAGIVIVFVVFFLLQREDLRDRFIRLAGARDLQRTTHALDDAARRLSRYLLVQSAINTGFGMVIGTGLWLIGVPNPILWGIIAMLLRFVPYIGPVIAAIFPAALAVAADPGWSMLLWTGALFLIVEPVTGQIVEPLLYSHSTGLSAVAVVVAAAFWTWLWGPVGLLLSTPLTLCLVVLGRHVERMEFLDIMLGDQPALTPEESFYQRMLASDPDEAARQAEVFLKEKPLSAYYDEIAVKGLALAQLDVNRGMLEHERRVEIKEAVLGVIDNLSDHAKTAPPLKEGDDPLVAPLHAPSQDEIKPVMCIAGRGSLDEGPAAMLAQLLESQGIGTRVVPSHAVSPANMFRLDVTDVQIICLSYLEAGGFTNARFLIRRLRRKLPSAQILLGFWAFSEEEAKRRDALQETGADLIVTSLQQAAEHVTMFATDTTKRAAMLTPQPDIQISPAAE